MESLERLADEHHVKLTMTTSRRQYTPSTPRIQVVPRLIIYYLIKYYLLLLMGVARSPGRSASLIHSARDDQVRGTAESLGSLSTSRPGPSEQTRSFLCIPSDTFSIDHHPSRARELGQRTVIIQMMRSIE